MGIENLHFASKFFFKIGVSAPNLAFLDTNFLTERFMTTFFQQPKI